MNIAKSLINTYFEEHLQTDASEIWSAPKKPDFKKFLKLIGKQLLESF